MEQLTPTFAPPSIDIILKINIIDSQKVNNEVKVHCTL